MNKVTIAKKHNSSKLQELLDEVEMEQTKTKMQLAARIEDFMRAKGWNKSQFADNVGKNPSEVTKWFSGTQNFTIDVLTEIAFALGIELSALFGKKQVQVIYQKEIILRAVASKPAIVLTTPMGQSVDVYGSFLLTSQKIKSSPYLQYYQA
jgi:transcriptional regulator with XRE-family HTH domain